MKQNTDLQSQNTAIEEKMKLNDTLVLQKNENIKELHSQLDDLKLLNKNLKQDLAECHSNIRNLETSLKVRDECNSNLENEKDVKKQKLAMREEFIKHQDEIIDKLSSDLVSERSSAEEIKNKLSVCLIKIKELDYNNKYLKKLTETNNDNFHKLDSQSKKLSAEFDSLKFKYDETVKDLLDATIKLQLTVKVRQESEHFTKLLQSNYHELKNEMTI